MNDLYDDDIPLKHCKFPERDIPIESDRHLPRWVGACCDMTAIMMYSPQAVNVTLSPVIPTKTKSIVCKLDAN